MPGLFLETGPEIGSAAGVPCISAIQDDSTRNFT